MSLRSYKIVNQITGEKFGVVAYSLDDLERIGRQKFKITSPVVILENDGVIVDSEPYFCRLPAETCFIISEKSNEYPMKLVPHTIVDGAFHLKIGVAVSSLHHLKKLGQEKFSIKSPVKVLLESDGTLVESEFYFRTRPPNTGFIILNDSDSSVPYVKTIQEKCVWAMKEMDDLN